MKQYEVISSMVKMTSIPLTQEKFALVDEEDADLLKWKWQVSRMGSKTKPLWYATRTGKYPDGRTGKIAMHRVIMTRVHGSPIKRHEIVDHINHDGLDNRRSNLRLVSRKENLMNCREMFWVFRRGKS